MRIRIVVLLIVSLVFTVSAVMSQSAACPVLVEQALAALGNNCADLERNTACYGFDHVDATFTQLQPPGYFSQPRDRAELLTLQTIHTAALDLNEARWGIAVMSVQANVPNTLPGQSVIFLLMGDTQVANAVSPAQALPPVEPVTVTTQARTNPHSGPDLATSIVGTIEAGTPVTADALSPDGGWVRIVFENAPAWISRGVLNAVEPVSALPVVGPDTRTPMQSFYFTTGLGTPECTEAPSVLTVNSPQNLKVDLTVNGATIRVGSQVSFQSLGGNMMRMIVHRGSVETLDGRVIRGGESINAALDDTGSIVNWQNPDPVEPDELELGGMVDRAFAALGLEAAPPVTATPTMTATPGVPPTATFTPTGTPTPPVSSAACVGPITHTVAAGENLFRIALRYDTDANEIARVNGLADPRRIYPGQKLIIPNPCSGFVNLVGAGAGSAPPVIGPTPGAPVNVPGVDCSNFRPTSPLGRMPYGDLVFYWDPAPGATKYRLNIYNELNLLARSYETVGSESNVYTQTTIESIGGGTNFTWEVQALKDGQVVCTTARASAVRDAAVPPPPVSPPPGFTASWACSGVYTVQVSYGNVPPGDTVTISFVPSTSGPPPGGTFAVPPYSQTFGPYFGPTTFTNGTVTTSSNQSVSLPNISC